MAMLAVSLSFSLLIFAATAFAGPYKCGLYKASGTLSNPQLLVVNEGKQGAVRLHLKGKYQKFAKAGFAVEVDGEIKGEIENYEGDFEVAAMKLIVPDLLANGGDELRLQKAKPCKN